MYAGRLVEAGPVRQIYNAPAHPYTQALLESIPRVGDSRKRLTAIDGQPPDPSAPPPGCAFHPRCPKIMDRCRSEAPPEFQDRKSTRLNSSHVRISYAVFCLKKKKKTHYIH